MIVVNLAPDAIAWLGKELWRCLKDGTCVLHHCAEGDAEGWFDGLKFSVMLKEENCCS